MTYDPLYCYYVPLSDFRSMVLPTRSVYLSEGVFAFFPIRNLEQSILRQVVMHARAA